MTRDFQDFRVTKGLTALADVNSWVDLPSLLITREHIYIENTGVSDNGTTVHTLMIRFYRDGHAVDGIPQVILTVGQSFNADFSQDINIAVRSNIQNGSFTFIESENIIRKGQREYDG